MRKTTWITPAEAAGLLNCTTRAIQSRCTRGAIVARRVTERGLPTWQVSRQDALKLRRRLRKDNRSIRQRELKGQPVC